MSLTGLVLGVINVAIVVAILVLVGAIIVMERDNEKLWHALSHHLRHTVFRTGLEVPSRARRTVRRHSKRGSP